MGKFAGIIFITLCCAACHSQGDMTLLSNWKNYPAPVNLDTIAKYANSKNNWVVFIKNDTVRVVSNYMPPVLPFRIKPGKKNEMDFGGEMCFLKANDGYLVGFYRGEWGGSLYWFSLNGQKHYKISNDEIVQFIRRDGGNYAIQGLAHMGMSEGSIIKIGKAQGRWISKEYLTLPTAPFAITVDSKKNFLVITSKSLFKVDSSATIHTLVNRGMWWNQLYPTSIVVKDSLVYAGMRGGVYQYNSYSGEKIWLMNH